jgi:hypothetical protein
MLLLRRSGTKEAPILMSVAKQFYECSKAVFQFDITKLLVFRQKIQGKRGIVGGSLDHKRHYGHGLLLHERAKRF